MAKHYDLGKQGEQLAVDFLVNKNYNIKETNWRYLKAEVDIIAQKDDVLIAVEVKTRSTNHFGNPEEFINAKKIQLLTEAMNEYVIRKDLDVEVRFDVIAITKEKNSFAIEHLKNAFLHF